MRSLVALVAVLFANVAHAQVAPELAAYGALGQRWKEGERGLVGATLALGVSSPASDPGPGIGLRVAFTGFPTRQRDPRIQCADTGTDFDCNIPEQFFLTAVLQATAVLIPYRTRDREFEFGVGASRTHDRGIDGLGGLVLTGAFSGRIRELTRLQLGYEHHVHPNNGTSGSGSRGLFQHIVRLGLVYGGTRRP